MSIKKLIYFLYNKFIKNLQPNAYMNNRKNTAIISANWEKNNNMNIIEEYFNNMFLILKLREPEDIDLWDYSILSIYEGFGENSNIYKIFPYLRELQNTNKGMYYDDLSIFPEFINQLNLPINSNQYRFLYIRSNFISDYRIFYEEDIFWKTNDFKKTYHLNLEINKLALVFNLHFCFFTCTEIPLHSEIGYKDVKITCEWLVCVDQKDVKELVNRLNQYCLEEKLEIFIEESDNGLYFLKRKYFDKFSESYKCWKYIFYSFDYCEELKDYYWLGYHNNKYIEKTLDEKLGKMCGDPTLIDLLKKELELYTQMKYHIEKNDYSEKYNKRIINYPDFVKETNIGLIKEADLFSKNLFKKYYRILFSQE